MPNKDEVVILGAARTPVGRMGGALADVPAVHLGATAIAAALERAGVRDAGEMDEVYMGNVVSAGLGQNIARQCAIRAGVPDTVGASTINKVCGASLKTVMLAAQAIRAGDGDLFVCGGVESMSRAPHLIDGRAHQLRYGHATLRDSLIVDGLWCAFEDWSMGHAAEFIADEFAVTREAMDRYALCSHHKAVAAQDAGRFRREIVPIDVPARKGGTVRVSEDEPPRRDTSLDALARLPPAFRSGGRVTAGNAPGLNDAAAAVVVASRQRAEAIGTPPLARIAGYAQVAMSPKHIFATPAAAIRKLLVRIGWPLSSVDAIELNEAFAAQALANGQALREDGWDWNRVNVNGGAIALGHPLGATGARMLTTLLYALEDRALSRGVVSLCLGGGEAVALAVERIQQR
jgi:acetyl-CoA C-acetyltransferase